jgi:uncharacterized protein YjiS (DUF1127 family)
MSLIEIRKYSALHAPSKVRLKALLGLWRSRRALQNLDAAALQDIGVTSQQARKEAKRLPWDVPHTWVNR